MVIWKSNRERDGTESGRRISRSCWAGDGGAGGGVVGRGAEVLFGPAGGFGEGGCGVERPVGIAEHFAGEEDHVGFALGNDGVGLDGVSDEADGGGGNDGLAADSGGKFDLVAGA